MKIGLSYSRCVRDIVDGKVNIEDVLVIVSRTDFDPYNDAQWAGIWQGYHWQNPEWASYADEDEDKFRQVSKDLWDMGKFHQPRKFGAHPRRMPQYWLETVLPSEELEANPAAKSAWEKFQTLAGLANVKLDTRYQ